MASTRRCCGPRIREAAAGRRSGASLTAVPSAVTMELSVHKVSPSSMEFVTMSGGTFTARTSRY